MSLTFQYDKTLQRRSFCPLEAFQGHGCIRNTNDTCCSSSSDHKTSSGHRHHGAESKRLQQSLHLDQSIKIPEGQAGAENFISKRHHFLSGAVRLLQQEDHPPEVQRTNARAHAEHRTPRRKCRHCLCRGERINQVQRQG